MLRNSLSILLVVGAFSALAAACSDDYGEACDLPASGNIRAFCDEDATEEEGGTSATCVFTNSAQCDTRMCARYVGSRDFCTMDCDPAEGSGGGCPSGSLCATIPSTDLAFCVPPQFAE